MKKTKMIGAHVALRRTPGSGQQHRRMRLTETAAMVKQGFDNVFTKKPNRSHLVMQRTLQSPVA